MSEVKKIQRWDLDQNMGCFMGDENGRFVDYEDYLTLKEKLDFKENLTEQIVALQQKLDAMAAENAALKQVFVTKYFSREVTDVFSDTAVLKIEGDEHYCHQWVDNDSDVIRAVLTSIKAENPTPATDAYLNSVRAEGAMAARNHIRKGLTAFHYEYHGVVAECADMAEMVAQRLRSGTHDTADKAGAK